MRLFEGRFSHGWFGGWKYRMRKALLSCFSFSTFFVHYEMVTQRLRREIFNEDKKVGCKAKSDFINK